MAGCAEGGERKGQREMTYQQIKDYPNYIVTTYGGVINLKTNYKLKPFIRNGVHYSVCLSHKGETKHFHIHSLVAEAFLGKRPKGLVVDHIDNDPLNNNVENLRYVTSKENTVKYYSTIPPTPQIVATGRKKNPWRGFYVRGGKQIYTGHYPTKEKAMQSAKNACIALIDTPPKPEGAK